MHFMTAHAFSIPLRRPLAAGSGPAPLSPRGRTVESSRLQQIVERERATGPGGPLRTARPHRRCSVRLLAAALLCAAGPATEAADEVVRASLEAQETPELRRPNFSGWWTLDREATTLTPPAFSGGRGGADIDRLFITHAANDTVIVGPETNGLKAWSYTPGREGTIPVGRDTTMRAAARWDGARLVAEGEQGEMRMHEVMSLSADGSRLTIEVTTTTPDSVMTNRLVYRKDRPAGACGTWAMPCRDFTDQQR